MTMRPPVSLGPMPVDRRMTTVDERVVRAPAAAIYALAADVAAWPTHLAHYRYVRFREHDGAGGGIVAMSANRPFGVVQWPTFWLSVMAIVDDGGAAPSIRFRHVGGVTRGMDVEWSFAATADGTRVRIVHVWDGPPWPLIGTFAARAVIGPVFVHGIATRTLAGLAAVAERGGGDRGRRNPNVEVKRG